MVIEVQFSPYEKKEKYSPRDYKIKIGDYVIVKTDLGLEMGKVVGKKEEKEEVKPILKKAGLEDLEKIKKREKKKREIFNQAKEIIKKSNLHMKLIDLRFSFDGGRIIFFFIASERIDFRNLVKELTKRFQKSIRMHQVGVREEAKSSGGLGLCGRELCCIKFLKTLGNVTTESILNQELAHRGAERLSGVCGRLRCCLLFEEEIYKEAIKNLPEIGSIIKTERGEGKVVARHALKQSVEVEIDKETKIEVPAKQIINN